MIATARFAGAENAEVTFMLFSGEMPENNKLCILCASSVAGGEFP